ncbi:hypothetical protein PAMP_019192 [Pampus punctatissimus]
MCFFLHVAQDYNRGMEDMRRLMEAEMIEREKKLRTAVEIMVLKERESWKSDQQQLLQEKTSLQRKLSMSEEAIKTLESNLSGAKETVGKARKEINSLNQQLIDMKEYHDTKKILMWRAFKHERQKMKEEAKKKDEQIDSLQQSLNAQKKDKESLGASADDSSLQAKVCKLEALLIEKEQAISRAVKKRRARTQAHIDTLALLNSTQHALKQSQCTCDKLKQQLKKKLSVNEESCQKELVQMEESFNKVLSQKEKTWRKKLAENNETHQQELSIKEKGYQKEISERELKWRKQLSEKETFQKELSEGLERSLKEEKTSLQRKLSMSEEAIKTLESNLSGAKETVGKARKEINSLNQQLIDMKEYHDTKKILMWRAFKHERQKMKEEAKKKDEQIDSLQQSLNAQKKDKESLGASADDSSLQAKVCKLEALLIEKEQAISRAVKKRRARTQAHIDTLALLNSTQHALKQSQCTCDKLKQQLKKKLSVNEESCQKELVQMEESFNKVLSQKEKTWRKKLAENNETHQQELSIKEKGYQKEISERELKWRKQLSEKETFQKELSEGLERSLKELAALTESWKSRAQQWEKKHNELEESLLVKEKMWVHKEAESKEERSKKRRRFD